MEREQVDRCAAPITGAGCGRTISGRQHRRGAVLCSSNMSTEELLAQVLRLPRNERARVAGELLSTLEEPEEAVAAAWAEELDRRSRDIAEGRVKPVDWDTAQAEILEELKRRRARRTAP